MVVVVVVVVVLPPTVKPDGGTRSSSPNSNTQAFVSSSQLDTNHDALPTVVRTVPAVPLLGRRTPNTSGALTSQQEGDMGRPNKREQSHRP